MSAGQSRNLAGLLKDAQLVYQDSAVRLPPVDHATLTDRARHFVAGVRFGLDTPEAMRRLHEATDGIGDAASLSGLLPRLLDGAVSLLGADFGNIQLVDPRTGDLRIVTQSGFDDRFVDYFAVVNDDNSVCGRAAGQRAPVVVPDVEADPDFAPHRGIAAASGFRAVQSIPLVDQVGRLVGMVSTHFQRPHRPADSDLRLMGLYADFAGQAIAGQLAATNGDHPDSPNGRLVFSALSPRDASAGLVRPGETDPLADLDDTAARYAQFVVTQLFSVGVRLGTARSTARTSDATDQLTAATGEVDRAIRTIRAIIFGRTEH